MNHIAHVHADCSFEGVNDYMAWTVSAPDKRGTQQTVSANICSEDLLSPMIFGLMYDEKNWSLL